MANKYYANNPYSLGGIESKGIQGGVNNPYDSVPDTLDTSMASQGEIVDPTSSNNYLAGGMALAQGIGSIASSYGQNPYRFQEYNPSINRGSLYLDPRVNTIYDQNIESAQTIGDKGEFETQTGQTAASVAGAINPIFGLMAKGGQMTSDAITEGNEESVPHQTLGHITDPLGHYSEVFGDESLSTKEKIGEVGLSAIPVVGPFIGGLRKARRNRRRRKEMEQRAQDQRNRYYSGFNTAATQNAAERNMAYVQQARGQGIPSSFYSIV